MADDSSQRRVRARITGDVQGVFFRASTRDTAQREGVTGWVSNEPDGSVMAELQGPSGAVDSVVDFLRGGPPQASVNEVDLEEIEPVPDEGSFEVR